MSKLDVNLPDQLKSFVDEQVSRLGYRDASEYLADLVEADRERRHRSQLESQLLAVTDGPFSDLTATDFDDVRREGRRILQERK